MYTVETHLRYLNDVRYPAVMNVTTQVIDLDPKRIWFAHLMYVEETLCATGEFMVLHYNTREGRTTPMPDAVQECLHAAKVDPVPDWCGRRLSLQKT